MDVNKDYGKYQCLDCGRFMDGSLLPEPDPETEQKSATNNSNESWVLGGLLYQGEISAYARSMVETLRFELQNGNREAALNTCERLLQMDRKFTDAHLWIAKLSDDPEKQKKHADVVFAQHPNNAEATRIILMLRGDLTKDEAKRSEDLYHNNIQIAEGAVEAHTDVLLCPICRGGLTQDDDGRVACAFCGYQENNAQNAVRATPDTSLAVALIKQRGKAIRWKVGERIVKCNECGAERVLPTGKMSGRCPFCNSSHVIT
jgi:DNA-directed RNA polymerase subunit RPC12/RpoP